MIIICTFQCAENLAKRLLRITVANITLPLQRRCPPVAISLRLTLHVLLLLLPLQGIFLGCGHPRLLLYHHFI